MNFGIENKNALVLGASSGLGLATAKALALEGAKVAIVSRDEKKLARAAQETGAGQMIVADLAQEGAPAKIFKELGAASPDILVINTGGPKKGAFETLDAADWKDAYQSLWGSTMELISLALPHMKKNRWGRILLVTSAAAREPMAELTISNAYRAGLLGLTKSVSNEIAQFGITINALLPGFTRTERLVQLGVSEEKMAAVIPARRWGEPEEFASVACFLASAKASYVTGQCVAIDGGYLRGY